MADADPFDLQRFVTAQAFAHDRALAELRAGRRRTHWMWFVFPQARSLGRSPRAYHYGISGLEEARAYLAHAMLGARLREAVEAVNVSGAASLHALFGSPDDMKFRSCVTLFARVSEDPLWQAALDRWCDGERDPLTLDAVS